MQTKLTSIEATQSLLDEKKIPALDENQYQLLADYLFSANLPLRLQGAETVFRHDKRHPHALGLFLACTFPSAQTIAHRLAHKMFPPPPDLMEELMYDGAVKAATTLLQYDYLEDACFPKILYRMLKTGAIKSAFARKNTQCESFGTKDQYPRQPKLDEQLIAKQMLNKIANLEGSPDPRFNSIQKFLRCLILEIDPNDALMPATTSGNRVRTVRIDLQPVMKKLGISRNYARVRLSHARKMLTQMFNQDGTLFSKNQPACKRR